MLPGDIGLALGLESLTPAVNPIRDIELYVEVTLPQDLGSPATAPKVGTQPPFVDICWSRNGALVQCGWEGCSNWRVPYRHAERSRLVGLRSGVRHLFGPYRR